MPKCPAREKEAVTGERAAPAPQGDHVYSGRHVSSGTAAEQSPRTLQNQLLPSRSPHRRRGTCPHPRPQGKQASPLPTPSWRLAQRPCSLLEALLLCVPIAQGLQGQDKGNFPLTRFHRTQPAMETPSLWA